MVDRLPGAGRGGPLRHEGGGAKLPDRGHPQGCPGEYRPGRWCPSRCPLLPDTVFFDRVIIFFSGGGGQASVFVD